MKLILLLICFLALIQPVFCNENVKDNKSKSQQIEMSKNSLKIGYFVLVKKSCHVTELKTQSLTDAEKFIHLFYPEFCENLEYQFQFSPYYSVLAYQKEIYIEKMRITKCGKYKRIKKFNTFETT